MAMHKAARDNNADEMQSLIVSGKYDINERDSMKRTPLHLACWSGHTEIVKLLLQSKAKTDLLANDNFSALHFASTAEIIKLLVKSNKSLLAARVSKGNKTALHLAIPKGNIEVVKCLIELGSDITAKTSSGQGCLELAKSDEMYALFKSLLQEKIDKQQEIIDKRLEQSNIMALQRAAETDTVMPTKAVEHRELSDLQRSTGAVVPSSGSRSADVANVLNEGMETLNDDPTAKLPDDLTGCILRDQAETLPLVNSVEQPSIESILGVRKPALTALQRRKKKVKESRSTMSSHLIDDDIDD